MAKPIVYSDYEAIRRVGEKYYKDVNFCAVVAIAQAARVGFGKAYHAMKRQGRQTRACSSLAMMMAALRELGLRHVVVAEAHALTFKSYAKVAPKLEGTYFVFSNRHVACITEGAMHDWSTDSHARITAVWRVVPL